MASSGTRVGPHRFAILVVAATLALIFIGGLVTSTGSGLAVPDWPLSFGQFFPPMVGGVLYEHGHRMAAGIVGMLTFVLAAWLWLVERRPTVRALALAAVAMVIVQALLGGATVLLGLPIAVSVAHACLAQAFLCLTVALALTTAPAWERSRCSARPGPGRPSLATLTALTAGAVYVQLIVGAVVRHSGAGLAIPDFPLAFGHLVPPLDDPRVVIHFAHRLGALAVGVLVCWSAALVLARHGGEPALVGPALLATGLFVVQVALGALTIWTSKAVVPTTTHVAVGAALLATTFALALRARHLLPRPQRGTAALVVQVEGAA